MRHRNAFSGRGGMIARRARHAAGPARPPAGDGSAPSSGRAGGDSGTVAAGASVGAPRAPRNRSGTGNRLLWTVVGVVLLAAGVLGALASTGHLRVDRSAMVLPADTYQHWQAWRGLGPALLIAGGIVLALLGALLLRGELRGPRGRPMEDPVLPDGSGTPGRTMVTASALRNALTRDLRGDRQVTRAVVHLNGRRQRPMVSIKLGVTRDADIGQVHQHVDRALARLASTSGLTPAVREVLVTVTERGGPGRVA